MKFFLTVIFSVIIGLTLELASLSSYLEPFRPQFLLMITLYWLQTTKQQFSIVSAWLIGLLLDITLFYPLGLNALTFAITAYITKRHRKWLIRLSLTEISMAFAGFYTLQIFMSLIINNMTGQSIAFNFWILGSIITSVITYPLVFALLSELCMLLKINNR